MSIEGWASHRRDDLAYPLARDFVEPDWQRLPGYRGVSASDWGRARWQRANSVRSVRDLKAAFGHYLSDRLAADIAQDQLALATMPMLIPPQMINTMDEADLERDPIRRYMAPAFWERHGEWPSHPLASRDPLSEASMWPVEGLTHRYPTKALVEIVDTCPQYCGHCTRMDLVGPSTPQVSKYRFQTPLGPRLEAMLEYLRRTPSVRDVVVSGGDIANVPVARLVAFLTQLVEVPNIREVRLASKSVIALPQHFLQPDVVRGMGQIARRAHANGVTIAVHTHANHANQITPLVARAAETLLACGFRDVRNQGVLLRGVNDSAAAVLELCFTLLDHAKVTPYYFYMCDLVPNAEHWRTPLWQAQDIQHRIMGFLPGYATPRIVCDVPLAGKLWVHQVDEYDRELGISYWTKHFLTTKDQHERGACARRFRFYDPIDTLPAEGQAWWRQRALSLLAARATSG